MRSVLPSVPGVPWWGAILVASGATLLGLAIDAIRGDELTSTFSVLYFLGCTLAVAAVRYRGLFTSMVQPPLLLLVAVPLAQQMITDNASAGLKGIALDIAYPLVNRFPVMLLATVVTLIIGGLRIFLVKQRRTAPPRFTARRAARSDAETRTPAPERRAPDGRPHRRRAARTAAAPRTAAYPRAAAEPARRVPDVPAHPRRVPDVPVHPRRGVRYRDR